MSPELSLPGEKPAPPSDPVPQTNSPVGIADFTSIEDGLAAGRRPMLEGLDWLRAQGYRTVLHVRGGQDDDSSDREQASRRGLHYRSIEVASGQDTSAMLREFDVALSDPLARPLFVYDRDGRAGALWYAHFRTTREMTEAQARAQASRIAGTIVNPIQTQ
jgi:protein tyrosine phosphatase (PTP) superfamily phosphohydrolase (DUF442 family)